MSRLYKPQGTLVTPADPPRWRDAAASSKPAKHPFEDYTNRRDPAWKGKGKAVDAEPAVESWKEASSLLGYSFLAYSVSQLHLFDVGSSQRSLVTFAKQLKVYLAQQLALGGDLELNLGGGDPSITRVEAGYVDVALHGDGQRPVMIEVDRASSQDSRTTSLFVLLPSSTSSHFPILLSKPAIPAIAALVIQFLSTRHDTVIIPLSIPPPTMLQLLELLVQGRDTSCDDDPLASETIMQTSATFAFPDAIAHEGLGSLTLILPPPLLAALTRPPRLGIPPSSFLDALGAHFQSITSLTLSQLCLVRFGAGRGTFIQAGQGGDGVGAKIKLYRKAGEEGELEAVLQALVRVAEAGR